MPSPCRATNSWTARWINYAADRLSSAPRRASSSYSLSSRATERRRSLIFWAAHLAKSYCARGQILSVFRIGEARVSCVVVRTGLLMGAFDVPGRTLGGQVSFDTSTTPETPVS